MSAVGRSAPMPSHVFTTITRQASLHYLIFCTLEKCCWCDIHNGCVFDVLTQLETRRDGKINQELRHYFAKANWVNAFPPESVNTQQKHVTKVRTQQQQRKKQTTNNKNTHPISGVFRFRKPLILRLILFVVVLAKFAAGDWPCLAPPPAAPAAPPPPPAAAPALPPIVDGPLPPVGVAAAPPLPPTVSLSSMLGCWSLHSETTVTLMDWLMERYADGHVDDTAKHSRLGSPKPLRLGSYHRTTPKRFR